jgi:8-oxo-dGTP pyrophosphatase MutT (NUDIX family)
MAETETTWDGLPVAPERPYACCVVVWREGEHGREFLVLHRLAAGGAGFEGDWAWTPPSGARQPGEAPDAAAARELREETGLMLPFASVPDAPSEDIALYVAQASLDNEVVLDHEHDDFLWLTLDEAVGKCLPPEAGACLANAAAWLDARTTNA